MKQEQKQNKKTGEKNMSTITTGYNTLDLDSLMKKQCRIVSSEDALQEITPVQWSKNVLEGKERVTAKHGGKN